MEGLTLLPPCKPENIAGCVRHYSSQLVRVLFLSLCILARNIYDHAFCLKMGNHRIRWYLGSQGEGKKEFRCKCQVSKREWNVFKFKRETVFNNLIFFSVFRLTKQNCYITNI